MPLYRGSVSKVIIAHMPPRQVSRLFADDHVQIAEAGMGETLLEFKENLRVIRRNVEWTTRGEVDPGVFGIAAPVFLPTGDVFASICLVLPDERPQPLGVKDLAQRVIEAARATSAALVEIAGAVT
jgi:DNA-binding IclR family transcriptional regulator